MSAAATAPPPCRLLSSARTFSASTSQATWSPRATHARRSSDLTFQEGDASDLKGLGDGQFDLVVSIFGAMFAPRPCDAAHGLVRAPRSGGRIVMGNWIPADPTLVAQILRISSSYSPPPPEGFVSPMTWGSQEQVTERFGLAGVPADRISFLRDTYTV